MKKVLLVLGLGLAAMTASAQDGGFDVSADVVSRYVWRGTELGNSPHIQPTVEYSTGGLAIGAWGSYGFADGYQESDLYVNYGFDFGLSVGLTDYYAHTGPYGKISDTTSNHAFELNLAYELKGFSLSANYMLNNTPAGAGYENGIMYIEAGYAFDKFNVFVGGGDGIYAISGEKSDFQIVNVGIGTTKDIKITDSYSLPIFGQVILNPNKEELLIVAGITF